jgi:hypothetical protein
VQCKRGQDAEVHLAEFIDDAVSQVLFLDFCGLKVSTPANYTRFTQDYYARRTDSQG